MRITTLFALAVACVSCSTVVAPQGAALFDDFKYDGHDSWYAENPLPGEDYAYNPILAGWYSDPSICTNGEGDYFIVTSTFSFFPGVPIFHSRDLVNWEQIGHVLSRESQLQNLSRQQVSGGIFAPDIKYNPANKTYYMITTNVGAGNFVVKTQDPWGEWSDPILLPEVQGIDPSLFLDDDGKAYIVNNDDAPDYKPEYDGHRTIRVIEYDTASDKTVGERRIIVDKGVNPADKPIWIEGPHIYKINGMYYLMCAEGGTGDMHSEVIFRSDKPMEGYKPWDKNPILTQRDLPADRKNPVTCAGHADIVEGPDGQWWAVFLACRTYDGFENLGRETFMLPVRWSEDGFPVILDQATEMPMIVRHEGTKRGDKVTFGNFSRKYDFSQTGLGMDWFTLRGPAEDLYSLTVNPGYLQLQCKAVSREDRIPAAVFTRINHREFSASTTMIFNPADSSSAGLSLFKDDFHQYYLKVFLDGAERKIAVEKIDRRESVLLASESLPDGPVELCVESDGPTFSFSYSIKGRKTALLDGVDASFLSTARAGGFTGTTLALTAKK